MKIAIGIVGALLVLAIIYYFLPQSLKTTISAVFTGSRTSQQAQQNSPEPSATTVAVNTTPVPVLQSTPSPSPVGLVSNNRRSPSPSATARGTIAGATTATGSATANARTTALPGTGFESQSIELSIIQVLSSALLTIVGLKLRKYI